MAELADIVASAQTVYDEGIKVIQDMTGWNKIDSGNEEVFCFRRPNDTDVDTFKAEMFVDKPPRVVARYLFDNWSALNAELNEEDIESFPMVREYNEDVRLYHVITKDKGVVNGRSFLGSACFLDLGNDTIAVVGNSLEDPAFPCPEGKVRGEIKLAITLYEPAAGDATRTHIQVINLLDPKGSIPAMIVNSVLGNRAKFYAALKTKATENA
jgi:hypothetical protein